MNLFDVAVLVILAAAILIGINSGALPQVGGLLGALGGAVLGIVGLPWIEGPLEEIAPEFRAIVVLGGILFLVGVGEAVGSAVGRALAIRLRGGVLGTVDRVLGGFVGAGQAVLVVWLVGGVLAAGSMRGLATQAQTSVILRGLDRVLPAPTESPRPSVASWTTPASRTSSSASSRCPPRTWTGRAIRRREQSRPRPWLARSR